MTPWLQDADVTLYHGDVLQVLRELPAELVDCCVTSPPYWGLRDYGTGAWEGGSSDCDHKMPATGGNPEQGPNKGNNNFEAMPFKDVCGKCGATRIDQQLGLEPTPEEYVTRMVEVFREVRRVLAAHGTVWLNLGDSYAGGGGYAPDAPINQARANGEGWGKFNPASQAAMSSRKGTGKVAGLKPKDLVGIPWRVAFALQADGWYLRSDIIWAKPNPMPESVTDRPTKAHEYVFLLSKQPRYFFDQEAVREKAEWARWGDQTNGKHEGSESAAGWIGSKSKAELQSGRTWDERKAAGAPMRHGLDGAAAHGDGGFAVPPAGRNIRSVWEIATQPYPEAHFATFPEELARRCIAAGTSERGKCPECGAPWVREVERTEPSMWEERKEHDYEGRKQGPNDNYKSVSRGRPENSGVGYFNGITTGWKPSCAPACVNGHKFRTQNPCVVLDPFIGSGTVAHVARKLGRHAVGIDLNESYLQLAARRLQQQSLFAEVASGL